MTPLATTFGARLDGVDLSAGCDEALLAAVREALREHKVVVLGDQHHLSPAQLQAFAERFGEAETAPHPNWGDVDGHPGVKKIAVSIPEPDSPSDAIDGHWHTVRNGAPCPLTPPPDLLSWQDGPPRPVTQWYTFLYAAQIPALGRDTLFADMEAAYSRLSPPLRHFLSADPPHHRTNIRCLADGGVGSLSAVMGCARSTRGTATPPRVTSPSSTRS